MNAAESRKRSKRRQVPLDFKTHGGARRGAGRKRRSRFVHHVRRAKISRHTPVHVTARVRPEVAALRKPKLWSALRRAFFAGCQRPGFRICHFSVQRDHIHLVCEADSKKRLASGMNGFSTRIARLLNRRLGREGKVFADRYHSRPLTSPREVKNALSYVLCNARRHGERLDAALDPLSSARYFDGWKPIEGIPPPGADPPVARPRSWLMRTGWRRHGLLDPYHVPQPRPRGGPRARAQRSARAGPEKGTHHLDSP